MIPKRPFGRTGHLSSRVIFGAAALGAMSEGRALATLDLVRRYGVNHIDTAASYGASEERLRPWLEEHRQEVFLATKTGERTFEGARSSLLRSLERLGVEQIDLIQLHNLVDVEEWRVALGRGGALAALLEAREQGLVRFLGVTGHGTQVARRHLESLERYPFDSVLLPYSFAALRDPQVRADVDRLLEVCAERGVAVQTIKAIARRRWQEPPARRFSWYEPVRDPKAIARIVAWVLSRDQLFLNTSSDATLLEPTLAAAARSDAAPSDAEMEALSRAHGIEPLFVRERAETVALPSERR